MSGFWVSKNLADPYPYPGNIEILCVGNVGLCSTWEQTYYLSKCMKIHMYLGHMKSCLFPKSIFGWVCLIIIVTCINSLLILSGNPTLGAFYLLKILLMLLDSQPWYYFSISNFIHMCIFMI